MTGMVLRRHRVTIASLCALLAGLTVMAAYAFAEPGYAVHKAELNDGGIWVTRDRTGQFGRLNKPISQLDGAVYTPGQAAAAYDIDVLQDGTAVVGWDRSGGKLYPINTANLTPNEDGGVALSGSEPSVAMGGGVLADLDSSKGEIRAMIYDPGQVLTSVTALGVGRPLATIGAHGAVAVASDGTIFAVSADKGLVTIARTSTGFSAPTYRSLGALDGTLSITSAGDVPLVLAQPQGGQARLIRSDGTAVPVTTGAVLQQAGPAAAEFAIATPHALLTLPVGNGPLTTRYPSAAGTPAAPVRIADCVYSAWAGASSLFASWCGTQSRHAAIEPSATDLVWRVNRGQALLNSTDDGNTWNVDSGVPQLVSDWSAIKNPRDDAQSRQTNQQQDSDKPLPPKPQDDHLGARPGVTTTLYVLDNDQSQPGDVLAVDSISNAGAAAPWLTIAPDGQSIELALPASQTSDLNFTYAVRSARGGVAQAQVTVQIKRPSEDGAPTPRDGLPQDGSSPRTWAVPVNGTVTIPVLADWRDPDGDPVSLQSMTTSSGRAVATSDGSILYVAPAGGGAQTIQYVVTDGHGKTSKGSVKVNVLAADATPQAPTGEPDYARGQVGASIVVYPLDNDLAGADPQNPTATLTLAGTVASPAGTTVTTDPSEGKVTVVATKPGQYLLSYEVAYGTAPHGKATIRVDVDPAGDAKPVTGPDSAVLFGQQSQDVDVLSNDSDPDGNLLAVTSATPADPAQLGVGVVDGEFVHVVAKVAQLSPPTQTVDYIVSDGISGDVHGQLTVTQLPPPADDTPVTADDTAVVRAGQSVVVPVLDNDVAPAGGELTLATHNDQAPAIGQLLVQGAGSGDPVGQAYVSGNVVRFVAPAGIKTATTNTFVYTAVSPRGTGRAGYGRVTILPAPPVGTNQPPNPASVEERVVAGDTVKIRIPTTGVDPDGDTVTVVGVASAPKLGRVLAVSASSITYQAFPLVGNGGTDTFTYTAEDTYGAYGTGVIQVAVVQPSTPQPPLAIDDTVTVAPGADVRVDVLANDLIAPDDDATVTPLQQTNPELGSTARLLSDGRTIDVTASSNPAHPVKVVYQLSDGLNSSRALLTVISSTGANLPPVAVDQYATFNGTGTTVSVPLLTNDYDPDGSDTPRVVSPASAAASGKLTVTLTNDPQVIPYVIEDSGGATASAVVYVPGKGSGLPYVKPGSLIKIPPDKATSVDLRAYVVAPSGKPVRRTVSDTLFGAPSNQLSATDGTDGHTLVLTGAKGYAGPAAVTFQVTDGASATTPGAAETYVTIPVQVGDPTPVLRCPSGTVATLVEGGPAVSIPVSSVCHVWRPDSTPLSVTASWKTDPGGTSLAATGDTVKLQASASTRPGVGVITVGVGNHPSAPTGELAVQVVKAGPLTVSPPIVINDVKAGQSLTVDIAGNLTSPFGSAARLSIVGQPTHLSGDPGTATASGTKVTVSPALKSRGQIVFGFVATDVADTSRADRRVNGTITVNVLGLPDPPTNLHTATTVLSNQVPLYWDPPTYGGGVGVQVTYTVSWTGFQSGQKQVVGATSVLIAGLPNAHPYVFTVTSQNVVGTSTSASNALTVTPDNKPTAPSTVTSSNPQEGALTLTWTKPVGDFSAVTSYTIVGAPGGPITVAGGDTLSATVRGLNDDSVSPLSVYATNAQGNSPATPNSGPYQTSAGQPTPPQNVQASYVNALGSDTRAVQLSWSPPADLKGEGPAEYSVVRNPGSVRLTNCQSITATTCVDGAAPSGATYTYGVTVINLAGQKLPTGHTSDPGTVQYQVASTPEQMTDVSLQTVTEGTADGQVMVTFTTEPSHGPQLIVNCSYTDNGASEGTCPGWSGGRGGYSPAGGTTDSQAVSGLAPGHTISVTLWETNGGNTGSENANGPSSTTPTPQTVNGPPIMPTSGGSCSGGSTFVVNWPGATQVGQRPIAGYYVQVGGEGAIKIGNVSSYSIANRPSDGYPKTVSVWAYSDNGDESANQLAISGCTDPSPPVNDPPTLSNFVAVPGGCCNQPGEVGIAWNTVYPSGSSGGSCNWSRDGVAIGGTLSCPADGRASRQFYGESLGEHTYCGWISMPNGQISNVLCQKINVTQ